MIYTTLCCQFRDNRIRTGLYIRFRQPCNKAALLQALQLCVVNFVTNLMLQMLRIRVVIPQPCNKSNIPVKLLCAIR